MNYSFVTPKAKRLTKSSASTAETQANSLSKYSSPTVTETGGKKTIVKVQLTPKKTNLPTKPKSISPPKVKAQLAFLTDKSSLSWLYTIILVFIGLYAVDNFWSYISRPAYCDTNLDCPKKTRCPANSFCIDGVLTCAKGFVKSHNICIKDDLTTRLTYEAIDALESILESQNPYDCSPDMVCYDLSVKSAKFLLSDKIELEGLMPHILEAVEKGLEGSIELQFEEGVDIFRLVRKKSWQEQYPAAYSAFVVAIAIFAVKLVIYGQSFYADYKSRLWYAELKALVLANPQGVSEKQLKLLVFEANKSFELWTLIENLRKSDFSICCFEAVTGAKPAIYWQKRKNSL